LGIVSSRLTIAQLRELPSSEGQFFESVLLVRRITTKTARNGNAFFSVELGDRTGSLSIVVFPDTPTHAFFQRIREGTAIHVQGQTDYYQDRLSPRLAHVSEIPAEELTRGRLLDSLVETCPEDLTVLRREFAELVARISHAGLRQTVEFVFEELGERFFAAPAAISMHHAYRGGLLEHTVHVARAAAALLPLYPEVNADLAIAGALVHDVGKTVEYSADLVPHRTRRGILQGHVVLGYQLVRKSGMRAKLDADRLERLEHIVLSHQGQLEWGAAALAATPEAVFVSMIDNLDAKLGMAQNALRQAGGPEGFSDFLPGMGTAMLVERLPE